MPSGYSLESRVLRSLAGLKGPSGPTWLFLTRTFVPSLESWILTKLSKKILLLDTF